MGMSDVSKVTRAIEYLQSHWRMQPDLDDVAAEVGLSGPHFQRLFKRWAGATPRPHRQRARAHARRSQAASVAKSARTVKHAGREDVRSRP